MVYIYSVYEPWIKYIPCIELKTDVKVSPFFDQKAYVRGIFKFLDSSPFFQDICINYVKVFIL